MTGSDAMHYHRERAEQERACARDSACRVAADAHLALAELHEQMARFLRAKAGGRATLHAVFVPGG